MLFKGTDDAIGRGHRAGDRLDRRPARRVHREGIRQLLHQGARRAPAARDRHPVATSSCNPAFAPDDIEREKKVDPRRDQDGRGHARRPRPRALHAGLLGEPSARPADSRHARDRRVVHARDCCATTSADATRRAESDRLGRRQPRARAACATWSSEKFGDAAAGGAPAVGRRRRRSSPQVVRPQQGARAEPRLPRRRAAIRRTTTTGTRATC